MGMIGGETAIGEDGTTIDEGTMIGTMICGDGTTATVLTTFAAGASQTGVVPAVVNGVTRCVIRTGTLILRGIVIGAGVSLCAGSLSIAAAIIAFGELDRSD